MNKWSVEELLQHTGSPNPLPGGGGVCGVIGALAVQLNEMGVRISDPKEEQEWTKLMLRRLDAVRDELMTLAEADGYSFQAVLEARRRPKDDPERGEAIERGYEKAIEIPEKMLDNLLSLLEWQEELAAGTKASVFSDVATAAELAYTCVEAVLFNVWMNVAALKSPASRETHLQRASKLWRRAGALRETARGRVAEKWPHFAEWKEENR
ncbi:MAG: cyclodeaminase/cyclohydrolase family protein [Ndongobacter sp.]|nr:cyclodeaminase/cyclohydrolase family protein [Ndongobacter sp.]